MTEVESLVPNGIKTSFTDVENDSDSELANERIPFAKNTTHNLRFHTLDSDNIPKAVGLKNKENRDSPKITSCKLRSHQDISDSSNNTSQVKDCDSGRPVTPVNQTEANPGQPLTPTANLKMLFSAVSPELRNREVKQSTFDDDQDSMSASQPDIQNIETEIVEEEISPSQESDSLKFGSRKEKSLGLLCQKFLQKYPEYPEKNEIHEICLDEVAKELSVERRRIYDIVNVLESVEIVSRIAKNKYAWHGKTNLHTTLAKLKALGDSEGFAEQIQKLKEYELSRELEEHINRGLLTSSLDKIDFAMFKESSLFNQAALRKDKSLGIMSQKFLMLFLCSKPKTVNLDLSAKILIGDANIDRADNAKFKTKIRRLYDIANILTSLHLIQKVHVTEFRGRKPAFKYIGPDIDNIEDLHICSSDGCHRPTSRHSMLDCIQNETVANLVGYRQIPIKAGGTLNGRVVAKSTCPKDNVESTKLKFGRHSSFEQICAVAEHERNKLYASEPSSPTDFESSQSQDESKADDNSSVKSEPTKSEPVKETRGAKHFILMQSGGHFHIIDGEAKEKDLGAAGGLPTKGFVRRKAKVHTVTTPKRTSIKPTETIVIKTSSKIPFNGNKQPTVIPLTKDQIDAVLRSLKVPVPVMKENATQVDAATQSSPTTVEAEMNEEIVETKEEILDAKDMEIEETVVVSSDIQEINEKTPVITVNNPDVLVGAKRACSSANEMIPQEKRIKLDFPSPPSSEDDRSPNSSQELITNLRIQRRKLEGNGKPSPQRALHLAPEFNSEEEVTVPTFSLSPEKMNSASESELGVPLAMSEDSSQEIVYEEEVESENGLLVTEDKQTQFFTVPSKTIAVQLPNQPPTLLQVPLLNVQQQSQTSPKFAQAVNPSLSQPMQFIQSVPSQVPGQSLNVVVPITFSPPLTPNSQSSPGAFTFPSNSNFTVTNVHIMQPSGVKIPASMATTQLIRPIATKPSGTPNMTAQIVPPQMITPTSVTQSTFFGNTPGGFVPITSSVSNIRVSHTSLASGESVGPARKLNLPDLST